MKHSIVGVALLCLAVVTFSSTTVHAANTYKTNPAGIAYRYSAGVSAYGRPGGMIIAGNCNRDEAAFVQARANGAELLGYIDAVEFANPVCWEDAQLYGSNTPKWPYPSYGARYNYPGTVMTDIRKGSVWSNKVVAYVETMMRQNKVDGVFLDVLGARLWTPQANWNAWPQWEKDQWTDGAVDLVRRLDASRRAINPRFIIVNNNVWERGDSRGLAAERYVDGIILEHFSPNSAYHRNYVGRTFGNLGHRRVIAIARSAADAVLWRNVQGVTHVSSNWSYLQVTPPPIGFTRLTDRPERFGRASSSGVSFSSGMSVNYKRGSKFWLTQKGTVLHMAAYLDGRGGPTGAQSLRMALYKDNGGRPGTLVVQSNALSVWAGTGPRWVYFPTWGAAMAPGAYWVMVHSGSNNAVARIASSSNANWHGNTDSYSDGAANPAGAGSLGSTTANVFVDYTRGY